MSSSVGGMQRPVRRSARRRRLLEMSPHRAFDGVPMQQVHGVHAPPLAEPVDAAHPLLEPKRVPRQLEVDHQPAPPMQVEAFAGGVGGQQHIEVAPLELPKHLVPHGRRHAAVDRHPAGTRGASASTAACSVSRYSVNTTAGSPARGQKPLQAVQLRRPRATRAAPVRSARRAGDARPRCIEQAGTRQPLVRLIAIVVIHLVPGEAALRAAPAARRRRAARGGGQACGRPRRRSRPRGAPA